MLINPTELTQQFIAVVPAAGAGKRMQANCPKQYLTIDNKTILEHTIERLLSHPSINKVIIALSANDEYYPQTSLINKIEEISYGSAQQNVSSTDILKLRTIVI